VGVLKVERERKEAIGPLLRHDRRLTVRADGLKLPVHDVDCHGAIVAAPSLTDRTLDGV
jgi:hypothetical protein